MKIFQKKSPFEKEWEALVKREGKFLRNRAEKKESFLNQKLAEKVPEKLQVTLDSAFAKAFTLIFEKGTGIIEKTYRREEQIQKAARALSKELLYMKFLQGIPLVGVVGGAYDVAYMKQIGEYAKMKYQKRFLMDKKSGV